MNAFQAQFTDKFTVDDRTPSFTFTLWNLKSYGILVPEPAYFTQVAILLFIQTIVAVMMAVIIYQFVILPQKAKPAVGLNPSSFLIGFGVVFPIILYEPLWMIDHLHLESLNHKMLIISLPSSLSLRCLEAMFGCTPEEPKKNILNYITYATIGSCFDSTTQEPIRTTRSSFYSTLRNFSLSGLAFNVLLSLLAPSKFAPFETKAVGISHFHDFVNMFSVNHLINNFLMTLLLSSALSYFSMGISLIYNIFFQVQTVKLVHNPIFNSKSPSDFWGRKWNTHIHSCLKGAIFKPVRAYFSRPIAVLATFVASGLMHECITVYLYRDTALTPSYGNNMIFFGWNAVLILLESIVGGLSIFKWIGKTFPGPLVSILVVLTALPLGHLFLSDWIEIGYFHHIQISCFMVVPLES